MCTPRIERKNQKLTQRISGVAILGKSGIQR